MSTKAMRPAYGHSHPQGDWCGACGFFLTAGEPFVKVPGAPTGTSEDPIRDMKLYKNDERKFIKCHPHCAATLNYLREPSSVRESHLVTHYGLFYEHKLKAARNKFILEQVAECLRRGLNPEYLGQPFIEAISNLPPEIRLMIAELLLTTFALSQVKDHLVNRRQRTGMRISLTREIWATFTKFEDLSYVASLSNRKLHPGDVRLYAPGSRQIDTVIVAQNHFGIRRLVFCGRSTIPSIQTEPGTWWHMVATHPGGNLIGQSDRVKLREVTDKRTSQPSYSLCWSATSDLRRSWSQPLSFSRRPWDLAVAMKPLSLNAPGTVGYLARWHTATGLVEVCSHQHGGSSSFYEGPAAPGTIWMFVPMARGEVIANIWCVSFEPPLDVETDEMECTMILDTSKQRRVLLGPYRKEYLNTADTPRVRLLTQPPRLATRGWIGYRENTLDFLFEHRRMPRDSVAMQMTSDFKYPKLELGYPKITPRGDRYFFSSALMDNVVAMSVSGSYEDGETCINGVLLYYGDGSSAALGQVRLDQLRTPIDLRGLSQIWFRFRDGEDQVPFIDQVTLHPPTSCDGKWLEVSLEGTLEWWYAWRTSILQHNRRSSNAPNELIPDPPPLPTFDFPDFDISDSDDENDPEREYLRRLLYDAIHRGGS